MQKMLHEWRSESMHPSGCTTKQSGAFAACCIRSFICAMRVYGAQIVVGARCINGFVLAMRGYRYALVLRYC